MIHHTRTSTQLPALPAFSLSPISASPSITPPTVSSSSTGATELSSAPVLHPYRTDLPPCPIPALSDHPQDLYHLNDHTYIPILPRTNAPSPVYKKRCETCSSTHDGSFGAGRFCSSRCARTVGGLAHRKKRMMERDAKQRNAARYRAVVKKPRLAESSLSPSTSHSPPPSISSSQYTSPMIDFFEKPLPTAVGYESPKSIMTIHNLLNPSE